MTHPITIEDQIAEIKAELAIRKNVYASWIRAGRMNKLTADRKFAALAGALHTVMETKEALDKANDLRAAAPGLTKLCRRREEEGLPE